MALNDSPSRATSSRPATGTRAAGSPAASRSAASAVWRSPSATPAAMNRP